VAIRTKHVAFRYKKGTAFVYRIPAAVKLILIVPLSILIMRLTLPALAAGIGLFAAAAGASRFSLREQARGIAPAIHYGLLYHAINLAVRFIGRHADITPSFFIPSGVWALLVCRLALIMQLSTLFFCTTSAVEIKEALQTIEIKARTALGAAPRAPLSVALSLLLSFIPEIFEQWNTLDAAYALRGGKNPLKRIRVVFTALLPILFYAASERAKALAMRDGDEEG
jgi:energy-coupling factor transporter transmembrane protein EcfT